MIRRLFALSFIFYSIFTQGQEFSRNKVVKKITVLRDTILLAPTSIYPYDFKVLSLDNKLIDPKEYHVDFVKGKLILNKKRYGKIKVEYLEYPDFVTRRYTSFDKKLIVPNTKSIGKLYSLTTNKKRKEKKLFEGLQTKGFILRGITSGNNQNAVTNASLDLTLSGKLSDNVSIRGNIFDTNIPLQQNGYSQNITDFDRIFVELFSKNWKIKGGDLTLSNKNTYFLNFDKQVSGVEVAANLSNKTRALASGAIVRGRFTSFEFVGTEGNQGPYKLLGPNNESAIIIVGGSDKVFINGVEIKRGEKNDYTIDYNLGEIKFNTTYPITNDMRVRVEFQYSDRSYTRFVTYDKIEYKADKFSIGGYFYNENDVKSQPIQQNLTKTQKQILADAGNDLDKMNAVNAFLDNYSVDKIQYKKVLNGAVEVFEHATDNSKAVYTVAFTNVGVNKGSYAIVKTTAIGTIFKYVGINEGDYNPTTRLVAPTKKQLFDINTTYESDRTKINAELAYSENDLNLFSTKDDDENRQLASKIDWSQVLIDKKWKLKSDITYQFIQRNFKTIQRFQAVEFNRNWSLKNPIGDQRQIGARLVLHHKEQQSFIYDFSHLSFSENFTGNKHGIASVLKFKNTNFSLDGSFLKNNSILEKGAFTRLKTKLEHSFGRPWVGAFFRLEENRKRDRNTTLLTSNSFKYKMYEGHIGVGDTTSVFSKFGVAYSVNDSVKNAIFKRMHDRKTFYINSQLIKNNTVKLGIYANYRLTKYARKEKEKALNSRVTYNHRLLKNFLWLNSVYETSSNNIAQQDYIYIKTASGQGFYTWIDYNSNGIQEFNEFEVAQFKDQANYLRVALPNLKYVPTQRAMWKQSVIINPFDWRRKKGIKRLLSHFYNQTHLLVENEREKLGNSFNLNPFDLDKNQLLGLQLNFRNSLYFNKSLQKHSFIYTYGNSQSKQQYGIGTQENNTCIHQLEFQHKFNSFWLLDAKASISENKLITENLINRNYLLNIKQIAPAITFLYSKEHRFSVFYHFKEKENKRINFEKLAQQKIGVSYFFVNKKGNQLSIDANAFLNRFTGNVNSPVGYQMLEGLQTGKNYTWNVLFNQKLNSYLNLNLSYFGRKNETTKAIHTGAIQLKAIF
nr:hypothetical protein [Tenacibaculum maritimum]